MQMSIRRAAVGLLAVANAGAARMAAPRAPRETARAAIADRNAGAVARSPPALVTLNEHEVFRLLKRQQQSPARTTTSTTYTLTLAPDATCGFLSGSPGSPVTCANSQRCMWETQYLDVIVCGINEWQSYLRCMPRDVAVDPLQCNDVCESDVFNLRCTATAAPFCRTYAYPNGVRDYRCASTTVTAIQSVAHTYSGQTGRTLATFTLSDPTTPPKPTPTPITTTTTPTSSSTSEAPPPPSPGGGGSSDNIGAIAGGAVGGFAVISLVVLAVFLIRRRSKNAATNAQSTTPTHGAPSTLGYSPQLYHQQGYKGPYQTQQHLAMGSGATSPMSQYTFDRHGANIGPTLAGSYLASSPQNRPLSPERSQYDAMSVMSGSQAGGGAPNAHRASQMSNGGGFTSPTTAMGAPPGTFQGYTITGHSGVIQEIGDPADQHRGQIHEMR